MLKADLRKICLTRQRSLSATERLRNSQQISDLFFQNFTLDQVKFLHIFLPIETNNEIETNWIYRKIWEDFPAIKILVPRLNLALNEIESVEYTPETQLALNRWEIPEPVENDLIEPTMIDLVVVPLLCFDERGFRVGYGKGFYDKFLAKCRPDCLKVGISQFPPIKEISNINRFDVTLDYCVTPEKVWKY